MNMNEPVLCYVEDSWAYFTTQNLADQWGDDWNDAPYEHNAGEPYQYRPDSVSDKEKKPWKIIKFAFESGLEQPEAWHYNSPYSVEQINNRAIPWLASGKYGPRSPNGTPIQIWAGTPMSEAIRLIHQAGGEVYLNEAYKG
jgi:hypothetical protein